MSDFKMSTPEAAVEAVSRLQGEGFEAMVKLPQEDAVDSFITAWNADEDGVTGGIAMIVRSLDPGANEQPRPDGTGQ